MTIISTIKKMILWPQIRSCKIRAEHNKCAKLCRKLINENNGINYPIKPKKTLPDKHIIWQYWGQGFDNVPEMVKICLDSVEKHCNQTDTLIIRLSDANIHEYVDLPDFITQNRNKYPQAIFSDLLRVLLLSTYGGCWLDATIFLSGTIPQEYWQMDFFMFQRDESETNKHYWSMAFSYYFGWGESFKVKCLNSIIFCKPQNPIISDLKNILLSFWQSGKSLPNYFFFQILFNELIATKYQSKNCPIINDCPPHYLQQLINDPNFKIASINEIFRRSTIHKLTYKFEDGADKLKSIISSTNLL